MPEDKLTHAERVRLESLSQAFSLASHTFDQRPTEEAIFSLAHRIEKWLLLADVAQKSGAH